MNKGANGLQIVVMGAGSASQVYLRKAGVSTIAQSTRGVPADGRYHHIAVTADGPNSARIYIDGDGSNTIQVSKVHVIQDTAFPLTFGSSASSPAQYDEFALYDTVLSQAQVSARYAAGAP